MSSNYQRSVTVNEGSYGDWHWEVSDQYSVALTVETKNALASTNLGLICKDEISGSCAYVLIRQHSPCHASYSHTLQFKFPKERFTINADCINTQGSGSIVLLPSDDDDGFRSFAQAMREALWVNVSFQVDGKQLSVSDFSLIGYPRAIKTASTEYRRGYFERDLAQANREMYESLRDELSNEEYEALIPKTGGANLVEYEYVAHERDCTSHRMTINNYI